MNARTSRTRIFRFRRIFDGFSHSECNRRTVGVRGSIEVEGVCKYSLYLRDGIKRMDGKDRYDLEGRGGTGQARTTAWCRCLQAAPKSEQQF